MNRRAVTNQIRLIRKDQAHGPQRAAWIFDLNNLVIEDGTAQLKIETVLDSQIAPGKWSVKRPALETDRLHGDGLTIGRDGEGARGRGLELTVGIDEIPAVHPRRIGLLAVDAHQFQQ